MCGQDSRSGSLLSYVDLEQLVRSDHPLRTIRTSVNEVLASIDGRFGKMRSEIGLLALARAGAAGDVRRSI